MPYLLISMPILAAAFLVYKRRYDIFTDRGSLRKLINPLNFNLVILILTIAQLSFASIIFYIFTSYFYVISIEQAIMAGAITTFFYSSSFLIFKDYGPYILFSFDKAGRGNRSKNFLLLLLWLIIISFAEGGIFNAILGIDVITSTFISCFAISVIAFLAT